MKAVALVLVLSLGGCAELQDFGQTVSTLTTSVANPVTLDTLSDFENGMILSFAGLVAYKRSCIAGALPSSCRGVVQSLQVYTRQVPGYLTIARNFVKNNDQVNAAKALATAKSLIAQYKATAASNNVQVQ